jgi:hypothetical protein
LTATETTKQLPPPLAKNICIDQNRLNWLGSPRHLRLELGAALQQGTGHVETGDDAVVKYTDNA